MLLLDAITTKTSSGVRFCAVQWAVRLFPFSDAAARYICMLAAADTKASNYQAIFTVNFLNLHASL